MRKADTGRAKRVRRVKVSKAVWDKNYACGCQGHRMEVAYYKDFPKMLAFCIFNTVSKDGSRFVKKGKLLGDVVIQADEFRDLVRRIKRIKNTKEEFPTLPKKRKGRS